MQHSHQIAGELALGALSVAAPAFALKGGAWLAAGLATSTAAWALEPARARHSRRGTPARTTLGTYVAGGRWVSLELADARGAPLLVEVRQRHPDDPAPLELVDGPYSSGEAAAAAGEARVLARGGQLGSEPEQLAGAPVRGQAAGALDPGLLYLAEVERRDCRRLSARQARRLAGARRRWLHVPAPPP